MEAAVKTAKGPRQESDASAFVGRFADAWASSEVERLMELLTDDVVLRQPLMPVTNGKAAARDAFERLFVAFPGLTASVHRWAAQGEIVFIDFTLSCSFGGRPLIWPAVDRFVLRDGLVAERVNYFDPLPLLLKIALRPRGWPRFARARMKLRLR